MPDTIETIITELKQRRDWNNPQEVEVWFEEKLREVEAEAKEEGRVDFQKKLLQTYKINPKTVIALMEKDSLYAFCYFTTVV